MGGCGQGWGDIRGYGRLGVTVACCFELVGARDAGGLASSLPRSLRLTNTVDSWSRGAGEDVGFPQTLLARFISVRGCDESTRLS